MTSPENLAALSDDELLNTLSRSVDGMDDHTTLDGLPAPLKVLWLLQDLDAEIALGGLLAYLTNSSGMHAPATVDALRLIGASQAAAILDRSIELIEHDRPFVRLAATEHEVLQPYADMPHAQAISQLGDDLAEALYDNGNFAGLLTSYLRAHLDEVAEFASGQEGR